MKWYSARILNRGFAILTATWIFLLFSTGLLITAHFMGQRLKAMKRLDGIERRIHKLHKDDFQGRRKFWPTFDRPPKPELRPKISRRKKLKSHTVVIEFGAP